MAALREAAGSVRETVALTGSFPGAVPFEEFLARADASPLEEPPGGAGSDDDPGLIIYTSGTTGRPKGALISHRALAEGCRLQATRVYHSPSVSLANLPVGHVAGLMDVVSVPLAMGGAVCFMEDFDPAAIPGVIERAKVTLWGQTPTMFQLVMARPEAAEAEPVVAGVHHVGRRSAAARAGGAAAGDRRPPHLRYRLDQSWSRWPTTSRTPTRRRSPPRSDAPTPG